MELEAANRRTQEAAEEIGRKHRELEVPSSKLARYLSPQVYASIFEGRQEIKLASERKKLTVFFSDIAGFTETTDKMESEDITQLLNRYLTEMSRVALEYGATIDKYVGDAIMIFFGDPETRRSRRTRSPASRWRSPCMSACGNWGRSGAIPASRRRSAAGSASTPVYCTVGNFGSEDRMDYTIVGGAVNLASRVEHEASPGGILNSYETHAHVKDEIRCEEMGRIQVRGIAQPVATYRVLDLDAAGRTERIRSDLPHLRLDGDPERMSADERRQAAALLQKRCSDWAPRRGRRTHSSRAPNPRHDPAAARRSAAPS